MQKYILVDTNIYLFCSLFSEEKEDDELLKSVLAILDSGEAKIILPEIIELEYKRKVRLELRRIKDSLDAAKTVIGEKVSSSQIKKEIKLSIDKASTDRESKIEETEKTVEKIFRHKNTIFLKLDTATFLDAYKRGIMGLKPYKHEGDFMVQPDCIVVEATKSFLAGQSDYELLICGADITDYATADKGGVKLHPDIDREFNKVRYYTKLHKLLQKEFGADISEEKLTITKAEKGPQGPSSISSESMLSHGLYGGVSVTDPLGSYPKEYFLQKYFEPNMLDIRICANCGKAIEEHVPMAVSSIILPGKMRYKCPGSSFSILNF